MNPERCLTLHRLLALLFFGSLMFTNCGGGGGGPSAPPSPPSFDIALDTTGLTISPGYSGTFNITLQPRNGFSGAVTVTISGFPQGVTATPASPFQLTGTTQKVTLTAASSTVTGNYAVSFQAKSGSLSASASMALQVEDLQAFFLSLASQELALDSGSSGSISFSVLNDGGALNYTLNLSVSGLPTGASGSFAKNPIAPTESGKLTIAASTNAPTSVNSPVTITATRSVDGVQRSAMFPLSIVPPAGSRPVNRTDFVRTDGNIVAAVYDPGHKLVFASNPAWNRVDVISPASKQIVKSIPVPQPWGLDLSPDGTRVLVGSSTQQLVSIDTTRLQLVGRTLLPTLQYFGEPLSQDVGARQPLALSNGNVIIHYASSVISTTLDAVWNPATGSLTPLSFAPSSHIGYVAKSGDGSKVVLADDDEPGSVYVYDVASASITATKQFGGYVLGVASNPSGTRFVIIETTTGNNLYDAQLNLIGAIPTGGGPVSFSRDGRYLYGVSMPYNVPVILTVDVVSLNLVGVAPAFAIIPPHYELSQGFEIETPFDIDETGLIFGGTDHGLALDDSTFYQNLSTTDSTPVFDKVVDANVGPVNASTAVTVETSPFDVLPDVWFGSMRGTSAMLESAEILHVTAPPSSTPGPVNVKILEPNGVQVFDPLAFTYGPTALYLSGSGGSPSGGAVADLIGLGLPLDPAQAQVTVGGAPATVLSAKPFTVSPGTIPFPTVDLRIKLPSGSPGSADITVTTSAGSSTLSKAFQYAQSVIDYSSPDAFSAVLFDNFRNQVYLSAQDHIDVFSVATRTFLSPISPPNVNGKKFFGGMALTPDGSKLLVTNIADGSVAIINPDSPSSANAIALVPAALTNGSCANPFGPIFAAATNTGKAFVQFGSPPGLDCPFGGGTIYELDLPTSTVINPPSFPVNTTCGTAFVSASRDGSKVVFGDYAPGMNYCIYDAASGSVHSTSFYQPYGAAASGDGNVFAAQWKIADAQATILTQVALPDVFYSTSNQPTDGLPSANPLQEEKLNDSGSLLYVPFQNSVDVFDVNHGVPRLSIKLAENVRNTVDAMAIDLTGRLLFLLTDSGLTVVELTNAPLSISTLSPASGAAGTQVTIRGSGFDPHASVSFNGTTVPARFVDADTLQVAVPASSAGSIQVAVKNPDGQTYVLDNGFITQ